MKVSFSHGASLVSIRDGKDSMTRQSGNLPLPASQRCAGTGWGSNQSSQKACPTCKSLDASRCHTFEDAIYIYLYCLCHACLAVSCALTTGLHWPSLENVEGSVEGPIVARSIRKNHILSSPRQEHAGLHYGMKSSSPAATFVSWTCPSLDASTVLEDIIWPYLNIFDFSDFSLFSACHCVLLYFTKPGWTLV